MPDTAPPPNRFGVITAVLILYFVWGSTYYANKLAIASVEPFPMLSARFVAAGALLYGALRVRGVPNPTRAQWLGSGTAGVLLLNGGLGMVVFAQQWVASSLAAIIVATMPLWLALFVRFLGEKTRPLEVLGMLLGLGGVALLNGEADVRAHPLALLVFVGPIAWAFGSAYSRKLTQARGLMASAVQMLVAGSGFVLLSLVTRAEVSAPTLSSGLAVIYLVVFGSIVGYSAYVYLLEQRVRPALATSYAYVNPLIAVLIGVGLGGERISSLGYAGTGVILLGVVLVVTRKG